MEMPPMFGMDLGYEVFESKLVSSLLRAGTSGIDVGAHTGHYTMLMGRYLSSAGRVLAIEPAPINLVTLLRNVQANGLTNVDVLSAAVSGQNRVSRFYLDGGCGGNNRLRLAPGESRSSLLVACITLDTVAQEYPWIEFLKLDLEGEELEALRGGERLLASAPNMMMMVEYFPRGLRLAGGTGRELVAFLHSHGFIALACSTCHTKLFQLNDKPFLEAPRFDGTVMNLLCLKGNYQALPKWIAEMITGVTND
jgi:FkbM family methyltransferase